MEPIALGWVDDEVSAAPDADWAAVRKLGQRLGYRLIWPDQCSVLAVVDQVRNSGADVVILLAPDHLRPLELNAVMDIADVETVLPRLSFARWSMFGAVR
ncbi:hypothetical protein [Nocardia sp. NPDC003345]